MQHSISLEQAKEMTALYRAQKENILSNEYKNTGILSLSETFEAESLLAVLNQSGCEKLRIYFGMDTTLKVHAIIVGVNGSDEEILGGENSIMEEGTPCPPYCPPPPPPDSLNYE